MTDRRNLLVLGFALFVVTLGFGVVMPIIPFYMERFGAGGTELGLLVAAYAIMRLFFGPIWGGVSDRVGRKPILMLGILGYGIAMVGFGLATALWMMFAARILSGVLSSATSPTTMAYIGDSTSEEDRSQGMGLLGAAAGLGTIFGPALAGVLANRSLSTPFFVAGALSLVALLLVRLLLPESLPESKRRTSGEPGWDPRALGRSLFSPVGPLMVLIFIVTAGSMIMYGVIGLYALDRFDAGTTEVGVIFAVLGLFMAVGQGLLVGPLTKNFGDLRATQVGFLASAASLLIVMWAGSYVMLVASIGLFALCSSPLVPAVTSITSKRAVLSQGVTMGLSNSFISLGRIFGPALGGIVFDVDAALPFMCGSAVMVVGWLVTARWVEATPESRPPSGADALLLEHTDR
ncbi:MAG: MFS transporter [Acidimicrobiia bacterium]|nr:MFS transporter [Acidimicrobiia bacterium]